MRFTMDVTLFVLFKQYDHRCRSVPVLSRDWFTRSYERDARVLEHGRDVSRRATVARSFDQLLRTFMAGIALIVIFTYIIVRVDALRSDTAKFLRRS